MLLKIHTLKGIKFEGQVTSLNAQTMAGEITVLDNHRPLISILKKGGLKIMTRGNNKPEIIMITGGFIEVGSENVVNILANL